MNFHSLSFAVFLLVVLVGFWSLARHRDARTALLLAASYFFYGSWELWYLSLIVFSTLLDYTCGQAIHAAVSQGRKCAWLLVSLVGNLGVLGFFKYWDWGVSSLHLLLDGTGIHVPLHVLEIAVPVGISFYTFQTLSYTIDVYRGQLQPARNLLDFAFFVAFFPQLVAGPIVRAAHFLPQMELAPRIDRERFLDGFWRIGTGLVKKVVLADSLGRWLVDPVFEGPELYSRAAHVLALYAFTFQIYYDFSGYSDIAIGVARLFGFDLPENFNGPFRSRSLSEFWRRWHMTLSSWVRDYVFFPLVGRRGIRSEAKVAFSILTTMVVIGVWHGAGILWVFYGGVQGLVMVGERAIMQRRRRPFATTRARSLLLWFLTFNFVVWVSALCIRSRDMDHFVRMLTAHGSEPNLPTWGLVALGAGALLHFLHWDLSARARRVALALPLPVAGLVLGLVCGWVAMLVVGQAPFIYFQF